MMSSAVRRGLALAILCCATACAEPDARAKASDPNTPAVVQLPPPILPSDTAKPDTAEAHAQKLLGAKTTLAVNYALLGAAIVFGDTRMIASQYATDAELTTPDSTYRGAAAIAEALGALGPAKSIRDFRRNSLATKFVDSTVIDSGSYVALSKRAGADSVFERGYFATTWSMHPAPMNWIIKNDRLSPDRRRRKKP